VVWEFPLKITILFTHYIAITYTHPLAISHWALVVGSVSGGSGGVVGESGRSVWPHTHTHTSSTRLSVFHWGSSSKPSVWW